MTEEEKKKQEQQAAAQQTTTTTQQPATTTTAAPATPQTTTNDNDDTAEEAQLRKTADSLREYGNSEVTVRKPASNPWQEFVNNKYLQSLQETAEQRAAREKREKTQRMIAAITDGLVGISNVAGAMGGATPVKQTPISIAANTNIEKAKAVRDANRKEYETARQYALKLQQAQDADLADQEAEGAKDRRDALAKAGSLDALIAKNKLARKKAKDDADYKKDKAKKDAAYRAALLKQKDRGLDLQAQRVGIAAHNASRQDQKEDEENAAYHYWDSLTPQQKNQYRDWANRRKTDSYGQPTSSYIKDDKAFIIDSYRKRKAYVKDEKGNYSNVYNTTGRLKGKGSTRDLRRSTRKGGTSTKKKSAI